MGSRKQDDAKIDWSAVNDGDRCMQAAIVRFVRGYRGLRREPVTKRQIMRQFRATPSEFVEQGLLEVVTSGRVRCLSRSLGSRRRANGVSVYELPDETEHDCTSFDTCDENVVVHRFRLKGDKMVADLAIYARDPQTGQLYEWFGELALDPEDE